MTEVSTRPQVGATKAPARLKKASSHTPELTAQATPEAPISDHESTVAVIAAGQLQGIYDAHWSDLGVHASSLLLRAARELSAIQDCCGETDRGDVFHNAEAAVSGGLAIIRAKKPDSSAISPLEAIFQTLESAAISYGFDQDPREALATGIRAGAQAPQPGRVGNANYSAAQLRAVLEFVASTANTLNKILMMAQTSEEVWERARLVDAAQFIAQQIGAAADEGTGGTVVGSSARWNYGPTFASKAGAA